MFNLIFGAIFTIFSLFFLIVFLGNSLKTEFSFGIIFPLIFIGIFMIVGLSIFIKGLKKVISNYRTSKNGEDCYALLTDILPTGSSVNGMPELKGVFQVYILSLNKTMTIEEIIGFNPLKYKVNEYIKAKYYNGDINISEVISENLVPSNAKRQLEVLNKEMGNYSTEDTIYVNGHTYKRID